MLKRLENIETLYIPESLYNYCIDHLEIMNNWKNDKSVIEKYPSLNREFTVIDAFMDLVAKGFIHE